MRKTAGWVLAASSMVAIAVGAVIAVGAGLGAVALAWVFLGPLPFLAAGCYLLWRVPENPTSFRLVALAAFAFAFGVPLEAWVVATHADRGVETWMWVPMALFELFGLVGVVAATSMVALLVDGRYRHRRERVYLRAMWLILLSVPFLLVSNEEVYRRSVAFTGVDGVASPWFVPALEPLGMVAVAFHESTSLLAGGGVVLLLLRYRKAAVAERRRMRWVLFSGITAIVLGGLPLLLGALGVIPDLGHGPLASVTFLPVLLLPLSIVIAVAEPRWLDVDFVVSKSVVYGTLSMVILLVYVTIASALGMAAGTRLPVGVAVVVTVVVAVVFQPARRRLQEVADRWVFGERPSGYEVLTDFSADVQQVSHPGEVLPLFSEVVGRAIGSRWVRIALADGAVVVEGKMEGDPVIEAPIRHGADTFGTVQCGPKVRGAYGEDDLRLVATLAGQAAMAISNTRLAGRIVTAQEAERRRIERNIHDGAQQELVALVAQLGMARSRLQHGDLDAETLAALQSEARRILTELRELAQGIHPSVLADGGLLEAVEDRCSRLPFDVTLDAAPSLRRERFADDVEGAAYFFVAEALANVLKHARASTARVRLGRGDGSLVLEVWDDGVGFDPEAVALNGIAGLRDRLAALGGSVAVASGGDGTTVTATLPVGSS